MKDSKPASPDFLRPKRILVTRADRIGDLVLSTPVFQELRRHFPRAFLACLTLLQNQDIVRGNLFLDEVIFYDKKGSEHGWFGNLKFASRLAAKHFDAVIHLHATNRMHLAAWLAGIPVRIGWKRKCAWALTHAYPDLKKEGKKHEAFYNFDLLAPLGLKAPEKIQTHFPLAPRAASSLEALVKFLRIPQDRPWVVLSPGASCPSKRWPAERFGRLGEKIAKQYRAALLVVGAREDRETAARLAGQVSGPLWDLTGRLSLGMLGVLLKRSAMLISNDSGPVHIAAAVGTPVVSIFGRTDPGLSPVRWRPLGEFSRVVHKDPGCSPCLAHRCQIHFLCLDAVLVEDVWKEVCFFEDRLREPLGGSLPATEGTLKQGKGGIS